MAITTGLFNTLTGNPAELNARSFASQILSRFPNGSAPMFALTSQTGRSRAKTSTHGYFTKTLSFTTITLATGVLIGDNAMTVPTTAGIVVGQLFYNQRTKENVRVSAITSGTVLGIQRAFGRVAAAAMNIGDVLI